ncbi:MAG: hypothetical protein A2136_07835, partial [Chloroflexi bacterium RBG_16_54_11]
MLAPYFSIIFLVIAIVFFVLAAHRKRQAGLPAGRVIYTDTRRWGKVEKLLFDPDLRLTGRPDYLVEHGDRIIPIEVKTGKTPQTPYDSHIFQLAAYCLLVQHEYGKRPDHGIIHYPKRTFEITYSSRLEEMIRQTIGDMQEITSRSTVDRS